MTEQIYFADTAVKITSTEARFGQRIYPVEDISTARYSIDPASKTKPWYRLTYVSMGAILLATVLNIINAVFSFTGYSNPILQVVIVVGGCLLFVSSALLTAARESFIRVRYLVSVQGSFGKSDVVLARNVKYAQRVTKALNKALKDRRKTNQARLRMT